MSNVKDLENKLDFYKRIFITKKGLSSGNDYLSDNIKKYRSVLGRISDIISTPDKFMTALTVALGKYSDYLIIDTLKNSRKIIMELNQKKCA